jgi:bifunctional DNA-binding transcriptional regulator/antitoxin component of YhaV-PrlF toxin-antitoxin module
VTIKMDAKRRLTLPASVAPAMPGDSFEATFDADEDAVIFRRIATQSDWLAVLSECPVSMDDVPSRRKDLAARRSL